MGLFTAKLLNIPVVFFPSFLTAGRLYLLGGSNAPIVNQVELQRHGGSKYNESVVADSPH